MSNVIRGHDIPSRVVVDDGADGPGRLRNRKPEQDRRVGLVVIVVGADGVFPPHIEMAERSARIVDRRDRPTTQVNDAVLRDAAWRHLNQHQPLP